MNSVLVLHGPNLNLLGTREPSVYGTTTLSELDVMISGWASQLGVAVASFQSNHEGALIDRIHQAAGEADGLIINAGALTHYSYALYDALVAVGLPTVEVHLSNIYAREAWRHESVIQPACIAQITGEGVEGYRRALEILTER